MTVSLVRSLIRSLLDLVYPPQCQVCGTVLSSDDSPVCEECRVEMPRLVPPVCQSCGAPCDMDGTRMCPQCPAEQHFDRARSGFDYHHEPMRALIHAYKFSGQVALAEPLGEWMLETLQRFFPNETWDLLVCVPLHPSRQRQREFNQVVQMCEPILQTHSLHNITASIHRVRKTRPQSKLTPEQRKSNLTGAFTVENETLFQDQRVLIVDDIFTTGSTVNELASVIRKAGARTIDVLTLCRSLELKHSQQAYPGSGFPSASNR